MLSKGLFYFALLIANGFRSADAHSPYANQVDFGYTNGDRLADNSNVDNEKFLSGSGYDTYTGGRVIPDLWIGRDLERTAVTIVQKIHGLADGDVVYNSGYSTDTADYAYLTQSHNGIMLVNAVANIALKGNKIFAFGSSFVNPTAFKDNIAPPYASIQAATAIKSAEQAFPGAYNGHPIKLKYYAQPDGSIVLVHVIQIQSDLTWFQVYVDAHSGQVVSSTNFRKDLKSPGYSGVDIRKQSIIEMPSRKLGFFTAPANMAASPDGWHKAGGVTSEDTSGNNAMAFIKVGKVKQTTIQNRGREKRQFLYPYNLSQEPGASGNRDAARTAAFYTTNVVHDIAYLYGFTEKAFNFQYENFGKGGKPRDRVLVSVQDNQAMNDAAFHTPPDGQNGICFLFLWNTTTPYRDGSIDNSVLVHELTHGITDRMTGGGTAECLKQTESLALAEGWSDSLAEWTEQTSNIVSDFTVSRWTGNSPTGIRNHPYSVNLSVNPLKYSNLNTLASDQHAAGEIWANMLHNVYAALVEKYGFSRNARRDPNGTEGNVVFLHLFMDALATQPCDPTFVAARDAIIAADDIRYRGVNKCLLWNVFASRGLGMNSSVGPYTDGDAVPEGC